MIGFTRSPRLAALLAGVVLWLVPTFAAADHLAPREAGTSRVVSKDVAIRGYDTVAYFTEGRAMQGKRDFEHVWNGSRWWFANAEHRKMFARDPERYAPRFGGYCTGGLSLGYAMVADPENWYIADGRLHLHHSAEGREAALANLEPTIAKAEETWATLASN